MDALSLLTDGFYSPPPQTRTAILEARGAVAVELETAGAIESIEIDGAVVSLDAVVSQNTSATEDFVAEIVVADEIVGTVEIS